MEEGFTVSKTGDFWGIDQNYDLNTFNYLGSLKLTHGVWNSDLLDFETTFSLLDLTGPGTSRPAVVKVEFSPDGQIGYVAALMDIGEVPISSGQSSYPVIFRTTNAGLTWSDPIPIALAGVEGMPGILNFLSDAEIGELYAPPLPERQEIPFTDYVDIDISVDHEGNPQIAVIVGVTGNNPYSIITTRSAESGYLYMASFLLSSNDLGEEGSWTARMLGRISNFKGNFGDIMEYNQIQIARDKLGKKMFVAWLDTDPDVPPFGNDAPDIWCRGYDVEREELTLNEVAGEMPNNVTFASDAWLNAYCFGMASEVFDDGSGTYTIPFVYQTLGVDSYQPVQYKYIPDFSFLMAGSVDVPRMLPANMEVGQVIPNPASATARFAVTMGQPATVAGEVTNIMGQKVSTLPARHLQAGNNEFVIDLNNLSAGIYFCTLTSGNQSVTRKMVVK